MEPMFVLPLIMSQIDEFIETKKQKIKEGLAYFGEKFVNDARNGGSYHDRTGNLRSSIGFMIFEDHKPDKSYFPGDKKEGVEAGKELAKSVDSESNKNSIAIIGTAGMEYAAAVESKEYTVLTAFVPKTGEIKAFFKEAGLTD